ncbi:hypothetical protein [uncultured Mediterranea sp.]|uniref:hypothetical protein n=1 Tax=uncultured Mediterranea sp. TaxID=1926662 RepID=UPI0027D93803|nr:hypothetical protein [uncultured Mediterranea sp.]
MDRNRFLWLVGTAVSCELATPHRIARTGRGGDFNLFIWGILVILLSSCSQSNSDQIQRYFQADGDSLALKSFMFLKQEMESSDWETFTMDKEFAVREIQNALQVNREQLSNGDISFDVFAEYLLSPIIMDEPLDDWREKCRKQYDFARSLDLASVCDTVNKLLSKNFVFGYGVPSAWYMGWNRLDTLKKGDCWHMAKSVLYPLRALGYPATIDYSPCWGNTTGGHAWNVVYTGKQMVAFMGREETIYKYNPFRLFDFKDSVKMLRAEPYRYPAKVYRKTFSVNKKWKQLLEGVERADIPAFLRDWRMADVTEEYFPVADVEVKLDANVCPNELVYLAVYSRDWTITAVQECREDGKVLFKDLKRKMLYLPVVYRDGRAYPIDDPFIIEADGRKRVLVPIPGAMVSCRIPYLLPLRQELSWAVGKRSSLPKDIFDRLYSGENRKKPKNGETYSLYYWDKNCWMFVEKSQVAGSELVFRRVPKNCLLFLADKEGHFIGRCFTVEKGEMVWW